MSAVKPIENWRDIQEYPGYQVSDLGHVRCCRALGGDRRSNKPRGNRNLSSNPLWRMLKGSADPRGYLRFFLCRNGNVFMRYAHRLVLESFIGQAPEGTEVCHSNDIKSDNRLVNLRWGTRKDNAADALKNGCYHTGANHPQCRIGDDAIREIRRLYSAGLTQKEIAGIYKLSRPYVSEVCSRRKRAEVL